MNIFFKKVPNLLGTFCLIILFSCNNNLKTKINLKKKLSLETEARYSDIAVPLGISKFRSLDLGFEYDFGSSITDLNKFYYESMELYGWRILSKSKNLIVYEKPHKIAIIEINEFNKYLNIKIRSINKI